MASDYDSDAIDSDTEIKLWSRVYHEPSNSEAHECKLESYLSLLERNSSAQSSSSSSASTAESSKQASSSGVDVHVSSDSDDEPSKSQLMSGNFRSKRRFTPSPSVCFIDIAEDSSDDEILILSDTANGSKANLVNINPLPTPVKSNSTPSRAKIALDAFLSRCRPEYSPSAARDTNNNNNEKKKEKKINKLYTGEVSLDLLNSLPGSSNRFKRIRKNSEEADLWRVNGEDLHGPKSESKRQEKMRYFRQGRLKQCDNCKDFTDHLTKDCPVSSKPTCLICGVAGHTANSCDRKFCTKCCQEGHRDSGCHSRFRSHLCNGCNLHGHSAANCPNIWRKYHTTTTHSNEEPAIVADVQVNDRIFCSYCGAHGHFAFECVMYSHGKFKVISSPLFYATSRMQAVIPSPKKRKERWNRNSKRKHSSPSSREETAANNGKRARQLLPPSTSTNITSPSNGVSSEGRKGKKKKLKAPKMQQSTEQHNGHQVDTKASRSPRKTLVKQTAQDKKQQLAIKLQANLNERKRKGRRKNGKHRSNDE